jgi:hypothetical protein
MLYSFGIGAIIDLPRLSGLIMGLDDWDVGYAKEIGEERLLNSVRAQEGLENVKRLLAAPTPPEGEDGFVNPFDAAVVGIPVAPFPRWMLCPFCRLLAPLESGLFKLKVDRLRGRRARLGDVRRRRCPRQGVRRGKLAVADDAQDRPCQGLPRHPLRAAAFLRPCSYAPDGPGVRLQRGKRA